MFNMVFMYMKFDQFYQLLFSRLLYLAPLLHSANNLNYG